MKQSRLAEFQRPDFQSLSRKEREKIYRVVRSKFGSDHIISISELEYEYNKKY